MSSKFDELVKRNRKSLSIGWLASADVYFVKVT